MFQPNLFRVVLREKLVHNKRLEEGRKLVKRVTVNILQLHFTVCRATHFLVRAVGKCMDFDAKLACLREASDSYAVRQLRRGVLALTLFG